MLQLDCFLLKSQHLACSLNTSLQIIHCFRQWIICNTCSLFLFFLFNVSFCTRFLILHAFQDFRAKFYFFSSSRLITNCSFWFYVIYGLQGFLRTLLIVCASSDPMRLNCSAFSVTLEHRSKHWSE